MAPVLLNLLPTQALFLAHVIAKPPNNPAGEHHNSFYKQGIQDGKEFNLLNTPTKRKWWISR